MISDPQRIERMIEGENNILTLNVQIIGVVGKICHCVMFVRQGYQKLDIPHRLAGCLERASGEE
jgi:hypothetical protein